MGAGISPDVSTFINTLSLGTNPGYVQNSPYTYAGVPQVNQTNIGVGQGSVSGVDFSAGNSALALSQMRVNLGSGGQTSTATGTAFPMGGTYPPVFSGNTNVNSGIPLSQVGVQNTGINLNQGIPQTVAPNTIYGNTPINTGVINPANLAGGGYNMTPVTSPVAGTPTAPNIAALFNTISSTEGTPGQLSSQELVAALQPFAPTGTFSLDSFAQLTSLFGLNRTQSNEVYAKLIGAGNGQVTVNQFLQGALTLGDQTTGTWNATQFSNVANALTQLSTPSANPVASTYNLLTGGRAPLTRDQLSGALTVLARGQYFTPTEFSDFTGLLGVNPQQSAQIYNSFAALTQNQPTVQNLVAIAGLVADQQNGTQQGGTWSAQAFQNVVNLLGMLPQYQQQQGMTRAIPQTTAIQSPLTQTGLNTTGVTIPGLVQPGINTGFNLPN
jgi:hypothetical protein